MTRIWIDVEDLFAYASNTPRPSGIQRLAFELERALVERCGAGGRLRFLRHDPNGNDFAEIPWSDVTGLYERMVNGTYRPPAPPPLPEPAAAPPQQRGLAWRLGGRATRTLPAMVRAPLKEAGRLQGQSVEALIHALHLQARSWRAGIAAVRALFRWPAASSLAEVPSKVTKTFVADVRPGDILLVLGSPWWHHDYTGVIARARRRHGLRLALLLYDLIPSLHPQWCDRVLVGHFNTWITGMLPQAGVLLAISQSTAADVETYAASHDIPLPGPVLPIPIGTGSVPPPSSGPRPPHLPAAGSYALFVSTIEARKNHALLFNVWRRLLAEMPREEVPRLVFAGRLGWMVGDLIQQIDNTDFLDGHVVIVEDPSDADLAELYRGCLFTLFPSFYEGWGLPVTESLAFGKPCLASNVSSLPEAGGDFARYFDPDDVNDAVRAVRAVLDDRADLADWERRIRRDFRPTQWSASADAVLAALE
jgi:glycosyltransferase involved in cell wall biosynthesis